MKNTTKWIITVLFVCTAVYSGVAAGILRGLGVYQLNSKLGNFLSGTWIYTAVAAFVLLIILAVMLLNKFSKKQTGKISAAQPQQNAKEATLPKAKKKTVKNQAVSGEEKIPPAKPTAPAAPVQAAAAPAAFVQDLPDLPAASAADTDTVLMPMESEMQAVPLQTDHKTPCIEVDVPDMQIPAAEETMLMEKLPQEQQKAIPKNETMPMFPEENLPKAAPAVPVNGHFCWNCGSSIRETAKFCGKCGAKLEGGGV